MGIRVGWSLLNPGKDLQSRWTGPFVELGNKTGFEAKTGPLARRLVKISQVLKDAHLALPPACWPAAYTLSRERF